MVQRDETAALDNFFFLGGAGVCSKVMGCKHKLGINEQSAVI